MIDVMSKLRDDHRHLVEIFDLIEREVGAIESGTPANFALLAHILEYIKYYPDVFHHPVEDLVLDCLEQREDMRAAVESVQAEHLKLAAMTKEFRDAVARFERSAGAAERSRVVSLGHDYVAFQRRHMRHEEDTVFPAAVGALSEDEWKRVAEYAAAASPEADPVFGPNVTARYRDLRQRIESHR